MAKKLILLAAALAAVAVMAVPAAASASPVLTMPSGTPVGVGHVITGTGGSSEVTNGLKTETSLGLLTCTNIMLQGTVTENSGSHIHGSGASGSSTGGCTLKGKSATVNEINLISIDSTTLGSGTFEASYKAEVPGGVTCSFTNEGEPGTFTYTAGGSTLKLASTEVFSAACGESFLSGEVKLETEDGTAVTAS